MIRKLSEIEVEELTSKEISKIILAEWISLLHREDGIEYIDFINLEHIIECYLRYFKEERQ